MIRKSIFLASGLALAAVVFFGRDAASYVWTSAGRVKESVQNSVPIEFEIDRARRMVDNLVPDIRRNMHVIAKEEVEVERLKKEIADSEQRLQKDRGDLVRLRTDVKEGKSIYHYAGRQYLPDAVKADLARRFERYKTNDATLASLRDIHQARLLSLDAAQQKLEGMLAAKRQLEVDLENLEARLKMVEVAQTTSDYQFDDSRLARVKDVVGDIRTRLNVAEKLVDTDGRFQGEIPLEEPAPENIADQIADYFQLDQPAETEVADAGR
jgi:peptidoglycan hydrolase CwlO-like protein